MEFAPDMMLSPVEVERLRGARAMLAQACSPSSYGISSTTRIENVSGSSLGRLPTTRRFGSSPR
jgi:hypothetical protein